MIKLQGLLATVTAALHIC